MGATSCSRPVLGTSYPRIHCCYPLWQRGQSLSSSLLPHWHCPHLNISSTPLLPHQATETRSAPELIVIACEVKVSARRGLTLVDVYGGMGVVSKLLTMVMRKSIYKKFDKVINHLKTLASAAMTGGGGGGEEIRATYVNLQAPLVARMARPRKLLPSLTA